MRSRGRFLPFPRCRWLASNAFIPRSRTLIPIDRAALSDADIQQRTRSVVQNAIAALRPESRRNLPSLRTHWRWFRTLPLKVLPLVLEFPRFAHEWQRQALQCAGLPHRVLGWTLESGIQALESRLLALESLLWKLEGERHALELDREERGFSPLRCR